MVLVLSAVALGIAVLIIPLPFFTGVFRKQLVPILFPGIPIAVLAMVTPHHWTALFQKIE